MYHVGGNLFLKIQHMVPKMIIPEEMMIATYWEVDQDPVPKCIAFVRNVVVLSLALYRVFKRMELVF